MFNPTDYGQPFAALLAEERLNALGPEPPDPSGVALLRGLDWSAAFAPARVVDARMADCCRAGLWLYVNDLEASHEVSQAIATSTGSYWHGILHRREPDSWNSKYWFDRVGRHPVYIGVIAAARELAGGTTGVAASLVQQTEWSAHRFVDLCESARAEGGELEQLCRRIQLAEWRLLFDYCYREAISQS